MNTELIERTDDGWTDEIIQLLNEMKRQVVHCFLLIYIQGGNPPHRTQVGEIPYLGSFFVKYGEC